MLVYMPFPVDVEISQSDRVNLLMSQAALSPMDAPAAIVHILSPVQPGIGSGSSLAPMRSSVCAAPLDCTIECEVLFPLRGVE